MKITPAHDFNDFEVGKRHELPQISVLDVEGKVSLKDNGHFLFDVPEFGTRAISMDKNISRPEKSSSSSRSMHGLLEKIEPHTNAVDGDRSNVVIEPFLTDQWYVNAKKLANLRSAVRAGKTKFVPKMGEDLLDWMENIQPGAFAPALVGPSDPGLVRPGLNELVDFQSQ